MARSEGSAPNASAMAALGVVLMLIGFPLQLLGHGVAALQVVSAALEPFDAASAICWELHPYNEQAWYRCLEPASEHPLDLLSWPTFLFPLPGLILSSIGACLVIRSAVGHVRRERFAWRVLITAWTLHLHGWLLLWIYFLWSSDVPRWIALVAVPAGALTVILVLRVKAARMRAPMGPAAWRLSLAGVGITSVASAATICDALFLLMGVDGVLVFGVSPAAFFTAVAGLLGLAAVAFQNVKSPGRGPQIPRLGDVPRALDP